MNKFQRSSAGAMRIQLEDALKHLLECDEAEGGATVASLAGAFGWSRRRAAEVLGHLRGRSLAMVEGETHHLTEDGRLYALQVVRTHRLYETWLARKTSTPAADWHREAHKAEHHLEATDVDAMADLLNNPRFDPHGDPIPTREGDLPRRQLSSLASWPAGQAARVEHIEDEPESLFRQAEALGLAPGTRLDAIRPVADGSLEAMLEGRLIGIPASIAPLIQVTGPDRDDNPPASLGRLSDLPLGGEALVYALAPSCIGPERRRLLDLGVVPGTRVRCEFASPFGSPRSYAIRGALIALRDHQAERILIHTPGPTRPLTS